MQAWLGRPFRCFAAPSPPLSLALCVLMKDDMSKKKEWGYKRYMGNSAMYSVVCVLVFFTENTLFGYQGGFKKQEDPYFYWVFFILFVLCAVYSIYKTLTLWPKGR